MKEFTLTASDGLPISCALFESKGSPDQNYSISGIVQIIHGAKERKEKYYDLASFLAAAGYHVVLSDLRGHGASVNGEYPPGHMGGWQILTDDLAIISRHTKSYFAEAGNTLPLTLFAHSFGSVLARCYLRQNDRLISQLIMTGTTRCLANARYIVPVCKEFSRILGESRPAGFPLKYGEPGHAARNKGVLKYSNGSVLTIWDANLEMQRTDWQAANPSVSILSMICSGDPATGGEQGLKKTECCLRAHGYRDFRSIIYPEHGHQPLFSGASKQAVKDIIAFLQDPSP